MENVKYEDTGLFLRALELCPTSVFILDAQGQITFANIKAEKILGISKSEITQRNYNAPQWKITDFEGNPFPDEQLPFSRVMATGEPVDNVQHALQWPSGARKYLSINAAPLKDENLQPNGMIATVEDITEIVTAQEALRKLKDNYKNLFENLVDEVHLWKVIKDKNGVIIDWELVDANPSALKVWKKTRDEVVGRSSNEIFEYDAIKQFKLMINEIFSSGEPYSWEEYFPPTNQYLSMTTVPFNDFFISTGRDVTEKKIAEKNLIKAKEKAEEASKLKTEYLKQIETVANKERDRISKILHDGIVQQLVAVSMQINHLEGVESNAPSAAIISELKSAVKSITSQVRDISHELQASDVVGYSLLELFQRLENQVKLFESFHFAFELNLGEVSEKLSDSVKTHLYRIAQELINNIIKHSQAKNAFIVLEEIGTELHLNISDNGVGNRTGTNSDGIGLHNISQRVRSMNGSISFQTQDGWQVNIVVPID